MDCGNYQMHSPSPCLLLAHFEQHEAARELAALFALEFTHKQPISGLFLYLNSQGLALHQVGNQAVVRVDFVSGSLDYRRQQGGGELIAKAVNSKQNHQLWDFTAGLGRDAFILANLGMNITLFERNQAVAALLFDGLNRAKAVAALQPIIERMQLVWVDVLQPELDFSSYSTQHPEVIYLDPMYPEGKKSATVKKEMAYFQQLVGQNEDAFLLLPLAKNLATKRVVVKRPRLGVSLHNQGPDYAYTGKSTRFDVYLPASLKKV